ncbi:MAG: hypothetical protein VKP72_07375 [bacterium]|nr:hypothetical protein [bacterium]
MPAPRLPAPPRARRSDPACVALERLVLAHPERDLPEARTLLLRLAVARFAEGSPSLTALRDAVTRLPVGQLGGFPPGMPDADLLSVLDALRAALDTRASTHPVERLGALHEHLVDLRWSPDRTRLVRASDTRRRSGMHYTPLAIATEVARDTIEPILAALGPDPDPAQILDLRLVDPAMGAGVFLLAGGRFLAEALVEAWSRHGFPDDLEPGLAAEVAAFRQIARRCLKGVDRDPVAVDLARISMWLEAGQPGEPSTFLPRSLRTADAIGGCSPALLVESLAGEGPPHAPAKGSDPAEVRRELDDTLRRAARGDAEALRWLAAFERRADRLVEEIRTGGHPEARPTGEAVAPPCHWLLAFPEVFGRERPGFDAVLGNPPFLNAIEARSARSRGLATLYRMSFPQFARGAYDTCVLFLGLATDLLRPGGRYGLLAPQALLGTDAPWQAWMHARWRPDVLRVYAVDRFEGAAIRVVAIAGGDDPGTTCTVHHAPAGKPVRHLHAWQETDANWYAAVAAADEACRAPLAGPGREAFALEALSWEAPANVALVPLSTLFEVRAGCVTAVAYALRPLVTDEGGHARDVLRLVTTGAIDRFRSRWGEHPVRFLGGKFARPRWPMDDTPGVPQAVCRARDAQRRPKVLVGGLTAVLEAWFDTRGEAGGVVSTWVLTPRRSLVGDPAQESTWLAALTVVLNAASTSRAFMRVHGAGAMSGHQTTIKKAALEGIVIPDWRTCPVWAERLATLHGAIARDPDDDILDLEVQGRVAWLMGRSRDEAAHDLAWWRSRQSPVKSR